MEHDKLFITADTAKRDLNNYTGIDKAKTFWKGVGGGLTCSTGFVEFTTLTAKQSALQCNITGTNGYMVTTSAPDPRGIIWDNATVERQIIEIKKVQFELLLLAATIPWSLLVSTIASISDLDLLSKVLPSYFIPEN